MAQQIYARIKRTSKYYGQTEKGAMFPVQLDPHKGKSEYVVHGNSNDYRLADVQLFIVGGDGTELRIA
ncbi:hypothetical protein [Cupriavidus nantongensis]|uniref:Uncharacterized protein n=1 Tax=Cupriavidus nantongensis TaxID=1796606 RepID=A0A142JQ66_9BURK|nr:hypothetical protein [Cupriavidus nantongensis]AMR80228.1 hypothetical protein A2G96_05790 [Cupriavidus nantongensis]